MLQKISLLWISFIISSCAFNPNTNLKQVQKPITKKPLNKATIRLIPGGTNDNWRYIGLTIDKNLVSEINESSIISISNSIIKFQDRKTIININQFSYPKNTVIHKYNLSWWQIDCVQQRYLLVSSTLYNQSNQVLSNLTFNNQWQIINKDSIIYQEYQYLCFGVMRNLGY